VLGNFAKADEEWLKPLLETVAEYIPFMIKGEHSTFMNRVAQGTSATGSGDKSSRPGKAKSHIHQARQAKPVAKLPQTGPMAAMLKKLFGGE
jgi:PTH1 family peptidyl-tRNA hydrolase